MKEYQEYTWQELLAKERQLFRDSCLINDKILRFWQVLAVRYDMTVSEKDQVNIRIHRLKKAQDRITTIHDKVLHHINVYNDKPTKEKAKNYVHDVVNTWFGYIWMLILTASLLLLGTSNPFFMVIPCILLAATVLVRGILYNIGGRKVYRHL